MSRESHIVSKWNVFDTLVEKSTEFICTKYLCAIIRCNYVR